RFSRDWSSDVCSSDLGRSGLADGPAQVDEPLGGRVEGPAAGDTIQLDRAQLVPALHVLADDARAARQRGLDRQIGAAGDQLQVRSEERRGGEEWGDGR